VDNEIIDAEYSVTDITNNTHHEIVPTHHDVSTRGMKEVVTAEKKVYVDSTGTIHSKTFVTVDRWGGLGIGGIIIGALFGVLVLVMMAGAANAGSHLMFIAILIGMPLLLFVVLSATNKQEIEVK
jgi:hypothetical protein